MSLRLEMLQVARLAPQMLGESAELVRGFLRRQQNEDGGFKDRTGQSDLYYTVFGLDGWLALGIDESASRWPVAAAADYLASFGDGANLDFVHLCCLARGWAAADRGTGPRADESFRRAILSRIERFRSRDGGFHPVPESEHGTAYGCFLGLGAFQDLRAILTDLPRMSDSMQKLRTLDGAWANERNLRSGSTNATAAAVTVMRNLGRPMERSVADWLLARGHPQGGFLAMPNAPVPDLLSTATALHALAGMQVSLDPIKESCLDFIDTLWTNEGGFYGHWQDDHLDAEYTFYALLALGHLSL